MKLSLTDLENCPVTATMSVIGGKWKILIIHLIHNDINRFGKLSMMLKDVSRQMLTTQLRDLERDGILERIIYPKYHHALSTILRQRGKRSFQY